MRGEGRDQSWDPPFEPPEIPLQFFYGDEFTFFLWGGVSAIIPGRNGSLSYRQM